jgi:hypothetical protein
VSKLLAVFVVSALLSAALQLTAAGCSPAQDECSCPAPTKWPPKKAERPITDAKNKDPMGRSEVLPLDLSTGTIQVDGENVVIRYTVSGVEREVIYAVLPNG